MKNIYLIGFMGAGKSSAGRILAKELGIPFTDTDELIEKVSGRSAAELIKDRGLSAWRAAEDALFKTMAASEGRVIALGGGVMPAGTRRPLFKKSGVTVYLECGETELFRRLARHKAKRPLLCGTPEKIRRTITRLLKERRGFYEKADITLNTSAMTPERTAAQIAKALRKHERTLL